MIIQIILKDDHGWPHMTVQPPIVQNGDNIKIQNYANQKYQSLKAEFAHHWEETKKARERVKNGAKFQPIHLVTKGDEVGKLMGNGQVKKVQTES